MTEHNHNEDIKPGPDESSAELSESDAASRSLSGALKVSFNILKIIMLVLVVVFIASGFFTVGPDEEGLVLRFGKIRGLGESRLLGPGLHWSFPYPVDEQIIIPVRKVQTVPIGDFWYFETEAEKLGTVPKEQIYVPNTLDPQRDGYCITRNIGIEGLSGNDYNIVHCKWQLTYLIDNPELFFRNVYVKSPQPGQSFGEVIAESISPFLRSLACEAIVATMVDFSIDEAILSKAQIAEGVKRMLQERLEQAGSGIQVVSMQLTSITWPRQVDDAFLRSIKASQESQKLISEAKGYAENILNEAGGPVVYRILAELKNPAVNGTEEEQLWSQLAGRGQERIAEARAYRTKVVASAEANAKYLQQLLPEYRKRPELVLQKIYQDAVEEVLDNADEKIIVQPSDGNKPREVRIQLNRDPALKSKGG